MKPFAIICSTCAAKLKVSNASAIGQKLACPKCGSMILVEAPEGWIEDQTASAPVADSSETDFDDIDNILQQDKQPEKKTPEQRREQKPTSSAPNDSSGSTGPVLPDESWTASSSQQRGNVVLIIAGIVGMLLVGGAILLAVNANRGTANPEEIAKNSGDDNENQPAVEDIKTEPENLQAKTINQNATTPETPPAKESIEGSAESTESGQPELAAEPANPEPAQTTPDSSEATVKTASEAELTEVQPEQEKASTSPFQSDLDDFLQSPSSDVDDVETNFDELASALESGGSSLFELNQFALLTSSDRRIGLPKYFIKLPKPHENDNFSKLDTSIKGIQYSNHKLLTFVAEMSQLTGVPIAFDVDELVTEGFDFGLKLVDFKRTDQTFASVIESAIETAGNQFSLDIESPRLVRITIAAKNNLETETIELPKLKSKSPEQFVELLKQLVSPDTWGEKAGEPKLETDGSTLQVTHRPTIAKAIRDICDKWNLASSESTEELASLWKQSAVARAKTTDLGLKNDTPILKYFAMLQNKAEVIVLVDFESLLKNGWNANTAIPFDVAEPNIGQLLDQISHSMDINYRAIDANTFQLLTKEKLAETQDVEFYDCQKILAGQLQRDQLIEIVRQSLQSAKKLDGSVRVYFEDELRSFIVVGPQDIQRLIESILKRLEKL